jgi:hypothetical protein
MVAKGKVIPLLLRPSSTEVRVVSAGPLGWTLVEGVHEIEGAEGKVRIAQSDQLRVEEIARFE